MGEITMHTTMSQTQPPSPERLAWLTDILGRCLEALDPTTFTTSQADAQES